MMLKVQYKMWEERQDKLVWKNEREEHKSSMCFSDTGQNTGVEHNMRKKKYSKSSFLLSDKTCVLFFFFNFFNLSILKHLHRENLSKKFLILNKSC